MAESLEITVNGDRLTVPDGTTVTELVALLGLGDRTVAVERNREVVPRATHGSAILQAGDVLEIVSFVGGG